MLIPDWHPERPLKDNILWLFTLGKLDIDTMYRILKTMRSMPSGKDKYQGIERAIRRLQKEGWPIIKEMDNRGVAWYSAGEGFMTFIVEQIKSDAEKIEKESVMREVKRLNEVLEMEQKMGMNSWD